SSQTAPASARAGASQAGTLCWTAYPPGPIWRQPRGTARRIVRCRQPSRGYRWHSSLRVPRLVVDPALGPPQQAGGDQEAVDHGDGGERGHAARSRSPSASAARTSLAVGTLPSRVIADIAM